MCIHETYNLAKLYIKQLTQLATNKPLRQALLNSWILNNRHEVDTLKSLAYFVYLMCCILSGVGLLSVV